RLGGAAARFFPARSSRLLPAPPRPARVDDFAKLHATLGKRHHRSVCRSAFPPHTACREHFQAHRFLRRGASPSRRFHLDADRPCAATPDQTVRRAAFYASPTSHQAAHRRGRNRIGRGPECVSRQPSIERGGQQHLLFKSETPRHDKTYPASRSAAPSDSSASRNRPVSLASDERNPPASNSVLAARTRCVMDAKLSVITTWCS